MDENEISLEDRAELDKFCEEVQQAIDSTQPPIIEEETEDGQPLH